MADTTARQGAPQRSIAIPLTAFAVGAVVAVLVGVFGRVHDPTLSGTTTLGFHTVLEMKTAVSVAIAPLLLLQLLFLPVAGGLLFTLLVLAVLTSAAWYIGAEGWPSGAG